MRGDRQILLIRQRRRLWLRTRRVIPLILGLSIVMRRLRVICDLLVRRVSLLIVVRRRILLLVIMILGVRIILLRSVVLLRIMVLRLRSLEVSLLILFMVMDRVILIGSLVFRGLRPIILLRNGLPLVHIFVGVHILVLNGLSTVVLSMSVRECFVIRVSKMNFLLFILRSIRSSILILILLLMAIVIQSLIRRLCVIYVRLLLVSGLILVFTLRLMVGNRGRRILLRERLLHNYIYAT